LIKLQPHCGNQSPYSAQLFVHTRCGSEGACHDHACTMVSYPCIICTATLVNGAKCYDVAAKVLVTIMCVTMMSCTFIVCTASLCVQRGCGSEGACHDHVCIKVSCPCVICTATLTLYFDRKNPLPRWGFLFTMFPDQEPCVRDFTTRCDRRILSINLYRTPL